MLLALLPHELGVLIVGGPGHNPMVWDGGTPVPGNMVGSSLTQVL